MEEYLIFFALVLGVNMLPAFGPPTWSIIALYTLGGDLALPILVPVGALAGLVVGVLNAYLAEQGPNYEPVAFDDDRDGL